MLRFIWFFTHIPNMLRKLLRFIHNPHEVERLMKLFCIPKGHTPSKYVSLSIWGLTVSGKFWFSQKKSKSTIKFYNNWISIIKRVKNIWNSNFWANHKISCFKSCEMLFNWDSFIENKALIFFFLFLLLSPELIFERLSWVK